jgi:hypothetical protein
MALRIFASQCRPDSLTDMSGTTPSGASAPRTNLDQLATSLTTRMVVREVIAVAVVALAMFVLWPGPGGPVGTMLVLLVGAIVVARAWMMPGRELRPVPADSATDPNAAAQQMEALAGRMMNTLMIPTVVGLLGTLLSQGWQPVMFGALITIACFTFFGPSRTRLAAWREKIEADGGKTGL